MGSRRGRSTSKKAAKKKVSTSNAEPPDNSPNSSLSNRTIPSRRKKSVPLAEDDSNHGDDSKAGISRVPIDVFDPDEKILQFPDWIEDSSRLELDAYKRLLEITSFVIGNPKPEAQWFKGEKLLEVNDRCTTSLKLANEDRNLYCSFFLQDYQNIFQVCAHQKGLIRKCLQMLELESVCQREKIYDDRDSGEYKCVWKNTEGTLTAKILVTIEGFSGPEFASPLMWTLEDDVLTMSFDCRLIAYPERVTWIRKQNEHCPEDDYAVILPSDQYRIVHEMKEHIKEIDQYIYHFSLEILEVDDTEDGGVYECIIEGGGNKLTATFPVTANKNIGAPRIIDGGMDFVADSHVRMRTVFTAAKPFEVMWVDPQGRQLSASGKYMIMLEEDAEDRHIATLEFTECSWSDSGCYRLFIRNSASRAVAEHELQIDNGFPTENPEFAKYF